MSTLFRRYEFLLPLKFNDGTQVPESLFVETLLEIEARFGAVSSDSVPTHGRWRHEGKSYHDDLTRIYVDVVDTDDNRQFFREYKNTLKARFQQIEVWMTTYPVEVL